MLDAPDVDSVGSVAGTEVTTVSKEAALVVVASTTSEVVAAADPVPVGTSLGCVDSDAEPQLTTDKTSRTVTLTAIGRPNILLITHTSDTSSTNVQGFPHFITPRPAEQVDAIVIIPPSVTHLTTQQS